jgi:hypothetical protein
MPSAYAFWVGQAVTLQVAADELGRASMKSETVRNQINEDRAAVLLGFTKAQLRELCEQSGLGYAAAGDDSEQRFFTYRELWRLCRWVARPVV